ncbi:exonuclease 1-like [Saccoglossus kowalevskii]|uniref:Exonuclease 1 n=1 Tax=Saccoglossus kowalevskii TaxID=10224 RepID=A0ABM0MAH2_SACKO|nr:PREDICTED: exonuclease 1-like isoform X2 [Saccoglossus kowalevskii]
MPNFLKGVTISEEMVQAVIKSLRNQDRLSLLHMKHIPQMAYLCKNRCGRLVSFTENSDVIVYGASKVFTKTDFSSGTSFLVEADKLPQCFNLENWTFTKVRYICILAGCDYLPSIPGIGIKRAIEFVYKIKEKDILQAIPRMRYYLNRQVNIPDDYLINFTKAENTFKYHLVFDMATQCVVPLNDYTDGLSHINMPYAGKLKKRHLNWL